MKEPLAIVRCGAVTPVGLTAPQTCAALRAGISALGEVYFLAPPHDPVIGAHVPAAFRGRGSQTNWLSRLAVRAILETIQGLAHSVRIALIISLPEASRMHPAFAGHPAPQLMSRLREKFDPFLTSAEFVQDGHAGFYRALELAVVALEERRVDYCCVGGVDSFLNRTDIERLLATHRVHLPDQAWGLLPGEGAAFVLLARRGRATKPMAWLAGVGTSNETDVLPGPRCSQGRGLQNAMRLAVREAGFEESRVVFRVSDVNGERYRALESVMAEARFYLTRREHMPVLHLTPSVGDVGTASGALSLVVAATAMARGYAPGSVAMCEGSSDEGLRGACVVEAPSA